MNRACCHSLALAAMLCGTGPVAADGLWLNPAFAGEQDAKPEFQRISRAEMDLARSFAGETLSWGNNRFSVPLRQETWRLDSRRSLLVNALAIEWQHSMNAANLLALSARYGDSLYSDPTAMDGGSAGRAAVSEWGFLHWTNAGAVLSPPLLAAALQEAARSQKTPEYLVVFNAPAGFPAESWSAQLQVPVRVEQASVWEKQEEPSAPLNLLQGQFEQKGQFGSSLRPYFPAAAMLLIWMLGNIGIGLGDWWKLRQQHQEYTREMTALLLSTFPETKTVLDPALQMQRSIELLLARTGHRDRDLLPLLAKTAAALRADTRVRLRGLRYADQSLTLELSWPAAGSPDTIKSALEAAGLHAEVLALTPRAGEVDGRLRLQPAAARPAVRSPS